MQQRSDQRQKAILRPAFAALLMLGLPVLSACSTPNSMMNAVTSVAERRSMAQVGTDTRISAEINSAMLQSDNVSWSDVDSIVYLGRVLMTGSVPSPQAKAEASRIVSFIPGVVEVINELVIAPDGGLSDLAKDAGIEADLKTDLIATSGVSSIDYRWSSVNGTLYIIGQARSQQEIQRVLQVAGDVEGLRQVRNYIRVSPGR